MPPINLSTESPNQKLCSPQQVVELSEEIIKSFNSLFSMVNATYIESNCGKPGELFSLLAL